MVGVIGDVLYLVLVSEILGYCFVDVVIEGFVWFLVQFMFDFVSIYGIVVIMFGVVSDVGNLFVV